MFSGAHAGAAAGRPPVRAHAPVFGVTRVDLERAALLDALCGAKVTINVPMLWSEVRYPLLSLTPVERAPCGPEDFLAASIVPEHAMLVTLVVTPDGATLVDTHQTDGVLYMARPRYQLRRVVRDDSVVHAFMYRDREGEPRLGVFDANKLAGEDVSALEPLQRHCRVFEAYHAAAAAYVLPAHVQYHGVFYEHSCVAVDGRSLPFPSSSVMRLPQSSSDLACERFLAAF